MLTAAQWEALSQAERQQRAKDRPAFFHVWDAPSSFAGQEARRPVVELTDAGGLTLHPTTIHANEIRPFLRCLVEMFL